MISEMYGFKAESQVVKSLSSNRGTKESEPQPEQLELEAVATRTA